MLLINAVGGYEELATRFSARITTSSRASGVAANAEASQSLCSNDTSDGAEAPAALAFVRPAAGVTGSTFLFGLISITLTLSGRSMRAFASSDDPFNAT